MIETPDPAASSPDRAPAPEQPVPAAGEAPAAAKPAPSHPLAAMCHDDPAAGAGPDAERLALYLGGPTAFCA